MGKLYGGERLYQQSKEQQAKLERQGIERQQQLNETNNRKSGLSSDEDESSSSSGGEEELEPLPPRLSNRAGAE